MNFKKTVIMKRAIKLEMFAMLIISASMLVSCKDKDAPDDNPVQIDMQNLTLTGTVCDTDGNPLGGALVSTGALNATTGADGKFVFEQAATVNHRVVVRFEKSGYFALTRSGVKADEMTLDAVMRHKGNDGTSSQVSFGAGEGKTLTAGGMKAVIPALALVRADGSAYTGTVKADMLYLDQNDDDFAEAMPGGDLAAIRSDNGEVQLLSYGMTEISLTDNAGNPLQLKDGVRSELTFPIPAGMENSPPATIPLWYFDDERGIWVEEGVATLQGNEYVGSVTHFSWHNLDIPAERVTIRGTVTDCANKPVSYVKVSVEQTASLTNSKGEYSVFVPANTPVTVTVKSRDYSHYTPEASYSVPGKAGCSVVTQNIQLPCRTQYPDDGSVFDSDQAKVTYLRSGADHIITFDNKGKRIRWDTDYGTSNHGVIINDQLAKIYTVCMYGTWTDLPYQEGDEFVWFVFQGFIYDEAIYSQINLTPLPDETIAGMLCRVFSYGTADCPDKIATWSGLIMLHEDCNGVGTLATDVSLNIPPNAFTKTMDIY